MATSIEWVQNPDGTKGETWNPVVGCTRVSAGCDNCYASALHNRRYRDNVKQGTVFSPIFEPKGTERHIRNDEGWWDTVKRVGSPQEGAAVRGRALGIKMPFPAQYDEPFAKVRCLPERLDIPLRRWKTTPKRIFVNSMADLFHEDVPDDFIDQVFETMMAASAHTFQVLTKRPERMRAYMLDLPDRAWEGDHGFDDIVSNKWPPPNVWLGVSAENQKTADERIPLLLDTPAVVRFVSLEPLLGPIRAKLIPCSCYAGGNPHPDCLAEHGPQLDWAIVGAESGKNRRPMELSWLADIVEQCQYANVPVFVKQDNAYAPGKQGRIPDDLWALKQFPETVGEGT